MRAEHRHELKVNDLAQWLMNLPEWSQKNLRIIIYGSLVIVLVLASFLYHRYQKTVVASREQTALTALMAQLPQQESQIAQAAAQGTDASYALLQTARELKNISQNTNQDTVAAMAVIKEAQILRAELQFRQGTITRQDLEGQVNKAKEDYTLALDTYLKKTPNRPLEALARFGLGLCEEDLGNFEQAKTIYKEVAENSAFEGTTAAAAAKQRLETMDFFINTKIALKPAPKPLPVAPPASEQLPYGPLRTPETQMPSAPPQVQVAPAANSPAAK